MSQILFAVPTLNSFKLLKNLYFSLRSQSSPNWKLLIIDGPSSLDHRNYIRSISAADNRVILKEEDPSNVGIFQSMNIAFNYATNNDWIFFWGSDDWAFSNHLVFDLLNHIESYKKNITTPDLIIGRGLYMKSNKVTRLSHFITFDSLELINCREFRKLMFSGFCPPHQATLFGPGVRSFNSSYSKKYKLSSDLNYFLGLTKFQNLSISVLPINFVCMGADGVSAKSTLQRLKEVISIYFSYYGIYFIVPIFMRYLRRISLVIKK